MIKNVKYTYRGMNKDLAKIRANDSLYYDARNIRLFSTRRQSTSVITNEQGNMLSLILPTIRINNNSIQYDTISDSKILNYTNSEIRRTYNITTNTVTSGVQKIIGTANSTEGFILLSTDNNGFDCIWIMKYASKDLELKYVRNMSFSIENPIQAIINFENNKIEKVYWVDGTNQLRHLNINHKISNGDLEELIDVPVNNILMSSSFELSQPIIDSVLYGGSHTAGRIQYAYILYKVNGSQTKLSPFSELFSLGTETRGGDVNEVVGAMPSLTISDIDQDFTNIKVYSIKYTSYGQTPTVSLIYDAEVNSNGIVNILDDGSIIQTLSVSELAFSGSDVIIPKHIATKDNRLLLANYNEKNFNVKLDFRAYSFNTSSRCNVYDNLRLNNFNAVTGDVRIIDNTIFTDVYNERHDSVNIDHNVYKYQADGLVLGGEGKYIKYTLNKTLDNNPTNKYFKDNEIYRLAIKFFNKFGQVTTPYWLADIRAPEGNLEGQFNTLNVSLKPEFYVWLNNSSNFTDEYQIPTGYQILVAERNISDRTIVAGGLVTSMMVNDKSPAKRSDQFVWEDSDRLPKMPEFLTRTIQSNNMQAYIRPLENTRHLSLMNRNYSADSEVMRAPTGDDRVADFWTYTSMMQMYSPEILFQGSPQMTSGLIFKPKGALRNTYNASWLAEKDFRDGRYKIDVKVIGGLTPHGVNSLAIESFTGDPVNIVDKGLFGHPGGSDPNSGHVQLYYRKYGILESGRNYEAAGVSPKPVYTKSGINTRYPVYGKPQYAERGQSFTNYNNDFRYRFSNSLQSILIDGDADNWKEDGESARRLNNGNVFGQRSIVFVLGASTTPSVGRIKLEDFVNHDSVLKNSYDPVIYGEFIKSNNEIYLGGIYGGNSYEDKKRTNYYEIGKYCDIGTNNIQIDSPGDTYVTNFRFIRMVRGDTNLENQSTLQYEEIVEYLTETTIDLKNRHDVSNTAWDSNRAYINGDYHAYNRVYSQNASLFLTRDNEYNTKELDEYNTSIIATSAKQPGETIDSWTNPLVNETMLLDGKYGPINSIVSIKDEIYTLQNNAFSKINVNPRVQITASDGSEIELGTGGVLHDYVYISTNSGTLNKWSVAEMSNGLIYYDTLNRNIMMFGEGLRNLTEHKGLKHYFNTDSINLDGNEDNSLLGKGVVTGYNIDKHNAFMTFNLPEFKDTLIYDDAVDSFLGFTDDKPSLYLNYTSYNFTVNSSLDRIYESFTGKYNTFYEKTYPSSITFCVSPEADLPVVLDNLTFSSEMYKDYMDVSNKTITHIRVYNEHQDSGLIPIEAGRRGNARQRYREWHIQLPRNKNTRERLRNPWNYVQLVFDNQDNKELVLNDITLSYTV